MWHTANSAYKLILSDSAWQHFWPSEDSSQSKCWQWVFTVSDGFTGWMEGLKKGAEWRCKGEPRRRLGDKCIEQFEPTKKFFQRWKPFAPKNSRRQTSHFDSGPLLWLKTPRQQTLLGTTLLGNILKPKCNKKTLAESLRVSFIISSLSSTLSKTLGLLTHRWRPLEQRAGPCWAEGHRVWCHPHGSRTET